LPTNCWQSSLNAFNRPSGTRKYGTIVQHVSSVDISFSLSA